MNKNDKKIIKEVIKNILAVRDVEVKKQIKYFNPKWNVPY